MFRLRKYKFSSFSHTLPDGREMIFDAFWPGFKPEWDFAFWLQLLPQYCTNKTIRVLGPFWTEDNRPELEELKAKFGPWDYFITGENRDNPVELAHKCIGYRLPKSGSEIRFPYWQWYLTWPGFEIDPPYRRFGERLNLQKLMQPMSEFTELPSRNRENTSEKSAVLLTSHLKRHRRQLLRWTDKAMGCDAFGRKVRPTDLPKKELLASYIFNLCPENRIAEGYVTEKVPEAFLCGCIPIAYCDPRDLERDFNPNAVINVFGSSRREVIETLRSTALDPERLSELRSQPLVTRKPSIEPLLEFLSKS